jgi:hypothetical protein
MKSCIIFIAVSLALWNPLLALGRGGRLLVVIGYRQKGGFSKTRVGEILGLDASSILDDLLSAQRIAGHTSPATTRIYDRSGDRLTRQDIERVQIGKKHEIKYREFSLPKKGALWSQDVPAVPTTILHVSIWRKLPMG